jgi:AcrR family transcriptional regulator
MDIANKILFHCFDVFLRLGIKSVSMDDISKSLGMSKKTLYNHFSTKNELVRSAVAMHIDEDEKKILKIVKESENAIDEMVKMARHIIRFFRTMSPSTMHDLQKYHGEVWRMIETRHFSFIYTVIKENIVRGKKEGYYREDINEDILAKLYVQQALSMANESVFPLSIYERSQLFKEFIIYHINGLTNNIGKSQLKTIEL